MAAAEAASGTAAVVPESVDELSKDSLLGTGLASSVYLANHVPTGQRFALKEIPRAKVSTTTQAAHVFAERDTLKAAPVAACPYIVNLVRTFKDDENLYFLLELAGAGPLSEHIRHRGDYDGDWPAAVKVYAAEVALALEAVHAHGAVYRDLKANNVVLTADGHIKLIDFGFAKVLPTEGDDAGRTMTFCGTRHALAPEMVARSGHGLGVDWWAFGVLLYEMLVGEAPFAQLARESRVAASAPASDGKNGDTAADGGSDAVTKVELGDALVKAISAGAEAVEFPASVFGAAPGAAANAAELTDNAKARDLIRRLMEPDPATRLGARGAAEVLAHPYFAGMDMDRLRTDPSSIEAPPFNEDLAEYLGGEDADAAAARDEELFGDF